MKFLRKLFGLHVHTFGSWTVIKSMVSDRGNIKVIQTRECSECHYKQFDSTYS